MRTISGIRISSSVFSFFFDGLFDFFLRGWFPRVNGVEFAKIFYVLLLIFLVSGIFELLIVKIR